MVWKKPGVEHLRIFECAAYTHVKKYERIKLAPGARKCIFLGYCTQRIGYCLYDEKTASVVESRDVIFNKFTKEIEMKQEEKSLFK